MKIDDIKSQLVRQATIFKTGGVRPTHDLHESWIGSVGWSLLAEQRPQGFQPLATIFLTSFSRSLPLLSVAR
ncbi:hypothetical protein [Lysinibacillus xylanilyticus]|uniref:hypothetical protein n=1 Tax=Lysinibacillus xylanilyticus TaxID=582475 RepID=UPI00381F3098